MKKLDEFQGFYNLSGIEFGYDKKNNANFITLRLNDVNYRFIEDYSDGYRSCMEEIYQVPYVATTFEAVEVFIKYCEEYDKYVIEVSDPISGLTIAEIGTDYGDQYYPCIIMNWTPENLSINRTKKR